MTTIKFWGVRGSIPTPGPTTIRYGGNTACVEVRYEDKLFILDAGSGLRALGNELLKNGKSIKASIFISHMHWDHIQGIPFFTPAFIPGNNFVFYGAEETDRGLAVILANQMNPTYFPIEMRDMGSKLEFRRLFEGTHTIHDTRLDTIYVNHPGSTLGYKFYFNGKTLVYISDNEPFNSEEMEEGQRDDIFPVIGEDGNKKLVEFLQDVDMLIHDAQYTREEYQAKKTWGHSPIDYTVKIASDAGIKKLILFHHDPLHDDDKIDAMLTDAKGIAARMNGHLHVEAAKEGMELSL